MTAGTDLAPCGTRTAYKRHRRRGEEPCEPCRLASREANKKYRPQYNEKRRERRRLEAKAQRTVRSTPERSVVVPKVVQGAPGLGPCTVAENGFLWDPRRDGETAKRASARHRIAKAICVTACPVFSRCRQEAEPVPGVLAGVIHADSDGRTGQ